MDIWICVQNGIKKSTKYQAALIDNYLIAGIDQYTIKVLGIHLCVNHSILSIYCNVEVEMVVKVLSRIGLLAVIVFMIVVINRMMPIALAQPPVTILIQSPASVVAPGIPFTMSVIVQSDHQTVDAAEIHLNFDPQVLQIVSLTRSAALPLSIVAPKFDNASGTIDYAAGRMSNYPTGTFELLTITAIASRPVDELRLTFAALQFPRKSDVAYEGVSLLRGVVDGVVRVALPTLAPTATPISISETDIAATQTLLPTSTQIPIALPVAPNPQDMTQWLLNGDWVRATTSYGEGWSSTASTIISNLQWTKAIDLRAAQYPQLRFNSASVGSAVKTVEVSIDQVNWISLGQVTTSETWIGITVDLSAYRGQVIWVRWSQAGERLEQNQTPSSWTVATILIDDSLPTATVSPTWTVTPVLDIPTLTPTISAEVTFDPALLTLAPTAMPIEPPTLEAPPPTNTPQAIPTLEPPTITPIPTTTQAPEITAEATAVSS
jgi:hypothetical protein